MPIGHLLELPASKNLQKYNTRLDREELMGRSVSFAGSPRKHPTDPGCLLLVTDPFSQHTSYYEFKSDDIVFAEEMATLVTPEGETVNMVRIWVRKGCIGLHCTPFMVEDTRR